jgi:hypothetical protein
MSSYVEQNVDREPPNVLTSVGTLLLGHVATKKNLPREEQSEEQIHARLAFLSDATNCLRQQLMEFHGMALELFQPKYTRSSDLVLEAHLAIVQLHDDTRVARRAFAAVHQEYMLVQAELKRRRTS